MCTPLYAIAIGRILFVIDLLLIDRSEVVNFLRQLLEVLIIVSFIYGEHIYSLLSGFSSGNYIEDFNAHDSRRLSDLSADLKVLMISSELLVSRQITSG